MKQCSYCGKEYSDDTAFCSIDQQPLDQPAAETAAQSESSPKKDDSYLRYPEYQWSARDAWKFFGMVVVFNALWTVIDHVLRGRFHHFYWWTWSGPGFFLRALTWNAMHLLIAAYFARTESIAAFWKAMGLDRKPTNHVWLGLAAVLGNRLGGHVIYVLKWAKGYGTYDIDAFQQTHGFERYFFLLPLLLAAFLEEPVYRGFLYKAFRGSFSMGASTTLVVAFTAYTHWNQYSHFGLAAIILSAWTVVQCYIREKSDSLWDCIICHLVFNASSLFVSHLLH